MILKIFNLKRGNRDHKGSSLKIDTLFMKKNTNKWLKGMDTRTLISQYDNLLSHAQYRDPYFDFMYFDQQLIVSV